MLYPLVKKLLFKLDAENAHDLIIDLMESFPLFANIVSNGLDEKLKIKVGAKTWGSPIGLAAGLDKNCRSYNFLSNIGFGAIEVGTVTPRPQVGNDKPRLFRYVEEESIRNCMGFNNEGSDYLDKQVKRITHREVPLGINIGKNKTTPDELAFEDYAFLYRKFKDIADYIVINVSSPNTPGLRAHQTKESLSKIFMALGRIEGEVDLYLKIAPDMEVEELDSIIAVAKEFKLTGIIATNTTVMPERGVGGISGKLLYDKARRFRKACLDKINRDDNLEFIGVGGFSSYDQIVDYWRDGGKCLQVYTAFIFQGPKLLDQINKSILQDIEIKGLSSVSELIEHYHALSD